MSDSVTLARLVARPDSFTTCDGVLLTEDFEPARSRAMQLMQSPLIARFYDRPWRPLAVRAVSSLDYAGEDTIVARHLIPRSDLRLLDLCCGTSRVGRRWIELGAEVLGVDCSLAMLRHARRYCASERLVLVRGDAGSHYAHPATFDAAFCFAALHLLENPRRVIEAAASALRDNAIFFAWAICSSGVLRSGLAARVATTFGITARNPGWLRRTIAENEFEVVEATMFGAIEFVVGRRVCRGLS